jgi:hypothetical protein
MLTNWTTMRARIDGVHGYNPRDGGDKVRRAFAASPALETGHCYRRDPVDDSRGEWAGLFSRSPKPSIDDSVPEPRAELTFTDLDELD